MGYRGVKTDVVLFRSPRFSSKNCQLSRGSFEVWLINESNVAIHFDLSVKRSLNAILNTIFRWNSSKWDNELRDTSLDEREVASVLRTKSDFFWESLSQHVSERVFGVHKSDSVFLFGPETSLVAGEAGEGDLLADIPEAHRLIIASTIDGRIDAINPQSRRITFDVTRSTLFDPEITLEVFPTRHNACIEPIIAVNNDDDTDTDTDTDGAGPLHGADMVLRAFLPRGWRQALRQQNTDYCDFNLVFIPLRHLVFENMDGTPRHYTSVQALRGAIQSIIRRCRSKEDAGKVCRELEPHLTSRVYGSYKRASEEERDEGGGCGGGEEGSASGGSVEGLTHFQVEDFGLNAFRSYMLGPYGLGGGLSPDFADVALVWGRHRFVCPEREKDM